MSSKLIKNLRLGSRISHRFNCDLRQDRYRQYHSSLSAILSEAYFEGLDTVPGIHYISLNRPQNKNAISIKLLKDFRDCLDVAQHKKEALVIRSTSPGNFCAGADLFERRTMSKAQISNFLSELRSAFATLENLSVPTFAAIDGPALGGGLELALACDFRVAARNVSKIGLPETRLGIIPGAGGTQRTVRLLGIAKAKNLIFTGRTLTALEALEWGAVDYISPGSLTAFEYSIELAKDMMESAPLALKAAKLAISRAPELSLEMGLDFEKTCYETLLESRDRREALDAFQVKRRPIFTGE